MLRADWVACALIACTGCAAGSMVGSTDPDSMVTTDPVGSSDASREAGSMPREAGSMPRPDGMMPAPRDAALDRDTSVMTTDAMVDGMTPPVAGAPNYGTFVVPQLTSAGTGRSPVYRLSLRIGAPQPYGHGAGAIYRVSLGTALGR